MLKEGGFGPRDVDRLTKYSMHLGIMFISPLKHIIGSGGKSDDTPLIKDDTALFIAGLTLLYELLGD